MKKIQLGIPEPCHENWNNMKPEEKGRFCNSCQKTVMDFRNMSDSQLAEFFKKPAGSVCGRFHADQLNRDITIPRKRIPWVKYFFQFSLPAFLFSMKAAAQGKVIVNEKVSVQEKEAFGPEIKKVPVREVHRQPQSVTINGKITDEIGAPIYSATVMIKGTTIGVVTDKDGLFSLKCKMGDKLYINSVGYTGLEYIVTDTIVNVSLIQNSMEMMGLIVFTSIKKLPKQEEIPLLKQVVDSSKKILLVFPNPLVNGQNLKIDVKQLEKGNYDVRILAADGSLIRSRIYQHQKENNWIEEGSVGLKTGSYYIQFINKQTGKVFTEKFIVQ